MRRKNLFFIALGIGAALLVVGYKLATVGADPANISHAAPIARPTR